MERGKGEVRGNRADVVSQENGGRTWREGKGGGRWMEKQ